jgi:DNA-binding response OmpR family regulator
MRILIVEDEWLLADSLCSLLEENGYEVVGLAPDAKAAFAFAAAEQPDLAFVDVRLRDGCTGPEIGAALARLGIAVIFVTGEPHLAPRDHAHIIGVLAKPVADRQYLAELASHRRRLGSAVNGRTGMTTSRRSADE